MLPLLQSHLPQGGGLVLWARSVWLAQTCSAHLPCRVCRHWDKWLFSPQEMFAADPVPLPGVSLLPSSAALLSAQPPTIPGSPPSSLAHLVAMTLCPPSLTLPRGCVLVPPSPCGCLVQAITFFRQDHCGSLLTTLPGPRLPRLTLWPE